LKILLAIPHYLNPNEGASGVTVRLADAYRRLGHQVATCGLRDFKMGRGHTRTTLMFPFRLATRYRAAIARGEFDVVDVAAFGGWVLGLRWPAEAHSLLVMRSHGLEHCYYQAVRDDAREAGEPVSWKYRGFMRSVILPTTRLAMRRAGLVLMLNREEMEFATTRLGIARERIRLVPNGIDAALLGLPFEPTPTRLDGPLRIAWIGAWQARKGPRHAVRALSIVMERFAFVEATLIGTYLDPPAVLAEFTEALRSRIRVIPNYENGELPALLASHQIALTTSVVEAFGVAQVEAMACGLAPVSPALGGPLEVIADGQDGILVPPCDPQAAADAVARLIEDRALLDSLRRNAQAKAQHFGWDSVARINLAIYEEFLDRRESRATSRSNREARASTQTSLNEA
jgi:glycosyltransferase involved in cell wall biosynthesis